MMQCTEGTEGRSVLLADLAAQGLRKFDGTKTSSTTVRFGIRQEMPSARLNYHVFGTLDGTSEATIAMERCKQRGAQSARRFARHAMP